MSLRRPALIAAAILLLTTAACRHEGGGPVSGTPAAQIPPAAEGAPETTVPSKRQQAEAHFVLGQAHEAQGDAMGAATDYEAALALDPWRRSAGDPGGTPLAGLARICEGAGPPAAVIRSCNQISGSLRFAPARLALFHAHRAQAHLRLGETDRALADLENAAKLDSGNPVVLLARGRVLEALGQNAAALSDYTHALFGQPDSAAARLARGRLRARLGDDTGAEEDFDAILSDPKAIAAEPDAYRERALLHCRLGQPEAAAVGLQVWAGLVPGGASYLADLLEARGYLRNPAPPDFGPHAQAGLAAWTRAGCPEG